MAFLATGTTVYAASAECDPDAQRVLRHAFPHHILFEDVAQVKASSFQLLLRKRNVVAVFIGAGPPCQPNSSLNVGGMGAKDPRAQLATHVVRVRAEFRRLPEMNDIPVVTVVETSPPWTWRPGGTTRIFLE